MVSWFRRVHRVSRWLPAFLITASGLILLVAAATSAQTDELSDGSADPIKLFERGQNAHAHGEYAIALDFYDQAIKLRPEFPEAEFQRGNALISLNRTAEAESAFRRAIELRKEWAPPYAVLGALLARGNRDKDAEPILRQALKFDPHSSVALRALAEIRLRAADAKEAVELARRATQEKDASASSWVVLAMAQRAQGDKAGAKTTLDHVLQMDPQNVAGLVERADIQTADGYYEQAIQDLKVAEKSKPADRPILSRLLELYQKTNQSEEAQRVAQALGIDTSKQASSDSGEIKVLGTAAEIEAANDSDPAKARQALEALLQKNPRNAMLLGRLGAAYRTVDAARSLEFYRRANELEPKNPEYASGYAAALVQTRRFAEAVGILRQVIAAAPDNYVAHANLATALYELKAFDQALPEYRWLLAAKPDMVIAYYFIATAHDKMSQFEDALAAYEEFLSRADANVNELEIEKVKLRLPLLKKQIKLGQGVKRKP